MLIVLQGMDSSGKDGTIRRVFEGANPQGVRVASFKQPSVGELDHDFLWRVHEQTPARGQITIFNRSHYEDVLIARVHDLIPREIWERTATTEINQFERTLTEEGTILLKFFLHISRGEQERRLKERYDPDEALEVPGGRSGRAQALEGVPRGLRGGDLQDEHGVGALAHRPVGPKVVPRCGGVPENQ